MSHRRHQLTAQQQRCPQQPVRPLVHGSPPGPRAGLLAAVFLIICDLASLPPRPYHVCTSPPCVRTSKTAADPTQLTVSSRAGGRRL
eukprot:4712419-Prymnesium_polylepis.1